MAGCYRRTGLLALVIAAWMAGTTTAAAQAGTAALSGTIKDEQGGALPGVTVTATNAAGLVRSTSTDGSGTYHLLALPPGAYDIRAELSGFRTAVREKLTLPVDVTTRFDVQMAIGALTETISVHGEVSPINVTDASLGNVISGSQVRALPLEANNVNGLLSLQPGAVYVPNAQVSDSRTGAVLNIDPRSGAVSGARADQSNITLDGIDVNDPQFGTSYASALRMTLDSLQEFRVSTSNYGAEAGRSSGPQVSLVTRSGTNDFHGSANWVQRDTRFSSNAYFLKLAQLEAGDPSEAPKLDKKIFGGSFGGPIAKDKLFFFGNYERLNEDSEAPVLRDVPSLTMRDGVLVYPCAIAAECPGGSVRGFNNSHSIAPGNYGLIPGDLAVLDPLGIGPSRLATDYFSQFPTPNDSGIDGLNLVGYRFAAPIQNTFNTGIGRVDYRMSGNHSLFGRFNLQDDEIVSAPQFDGQAPNTTRKVKSRGVALGWDAVLSSSMVNTFRYGLTTIKEDIVGLQTSSQVSFRNIDNFDALTASSAPRHPDAQFRQRSGVGERRAHVEVWRQRAVQPGRNEQQRQLVPHPQRQRLVGGRRRHDLHAGGRLRRVRVVPGGVRRRRVVVWRHLRAAARHHLGDDRRTTTTTARATCCPWASPCVGALRPTSTSSTSRTAGRSARP